MEASGQLHDPAAFLLVKGPLVHIESIIEVVSRNQLYYLRLRNELDGARSTHGRDERCIRNVYIWLISCCYEF